MIHKIGYPYSYGDELTPKMAGNNRKQAVSYSVLIPSIWWHNLGFGEPIQSYSPFSNQPKTVIVRVVETSRVNSINRGGDLGKSGPGPRAKADALKNPRKTGGGSLFVQGFTPQRQYGSHPINNKPLSSRNNVKIKDDLFNPNHDDRFDKLSKNPETNQIDRKSRTEAITILQAENKGIVNNARRPNLENGEPNLDFLIDGPGPYKYVDVKNPIDPRKYSSAKKKPESFNKIAKRIGEKIRKQKGGSNDVLHIVDLEKLPSEIKANFTQKVIESAGRPNGIEFIN